AYGALGVCRPSQLVDIPDARRLRICCPVVRRRDDRLWFRVPDDVPEFALLVQDVHRHADHAESYAGEIEVDELDTVREMDREAIAAPQPARRQLAGHAIGARVHVAERQRSNRTAVVIIEGRAIGPALE